MLLLIYNKSIRYYIKLILQYCNAYFREYFIDLSSKNKTYDKSIKYFYLIHFFICTLLIFFIFNRFLNFDYNIFNLIIFILILSKCLNNIYLIWQFRVKFLKSFQKMDFLLKKIIFTVLSNLSIFFNSLIICFFIYQIYLLFI